MTISVKNLSIIFSKSNNSSNHLKDFFLNLLRFSSTSDKKSFYALKNINFSISKGEVVGIIGVNGSGKSTLLKVLAGIYTPTHGNIDIQGRVGALLEIGSGFHPELNGRENLYLNCALLGLSRAQIKESESEILEFADLDESINMPVKYYSTGMNLRLGFSINSTVSRNILIMDEFFAGADKGFIEKAKVKLEKIIKSAETVIIVSHDLEVIRYFCNRLIWLDQGQICEDGDVDRVINSYIKSI